VAYLFLVRSMRGRYVLALLFAGILTSCDTFESHEYRITRSSRGDAARVQRILRDIAAETGIPRSAPTPYDSPTIALYRDSKVQLRASASQGDIRVMLMRYGWPAPQAFIRADALLAPSLSATFGRRFRVEPPADIERVITTY
jgi:hypothetical protein